MGDEGWPLASLMFTKTIVSQATPQYGFIRNDVIFSVIKHCFTGGPPLVRFWDLEKTVLCKIRTNEYYIAHFH